MSGKWDDPSVPNKGWKHVWTEDVCSDCEPGEECDYSTCEMCGNERIRYVHHMEHERHEGLTVGCVCAANMSDEDVDKYKLREKDLRTRATTRKRWEDNGWKLSKNNNLWRNADGFNIVIMQSKYAPYKWAYGIDGGFSAWCYMDQRAVKLAVFDAWWELSRQMAKTAKIKPQQNQQVKSPHAQDY